eukprot:TRINITY_DN6026_c1_g4_i1.p1 TRINITY_DN6026_c1_g4~~TRINITY_DN6026_c1_g4_i1.p1  ORF type:complete len:573 (-),score=78.05 TRINITY_DN6026_c1_g4_i1:184-1902(-)
MRQNLLIRQSKKILTEFDTAAPTPEITTPPPVYGTPSSTSGSDSPVTTPEITTPPPVYSTPSPTSDRRTPSPTQDRETPSPVYGTPSPTQDRGTPSRTPSPTPDRETFPPVYGTPSPTSDTRTPSPTQDRETPPPVYGTPSPTFDRGTPSTTPDRITPTPTPNRDTPPPVYGTPSSTPDIRTPSPTPSESTPFVTPPIYGTPPPNFICECPPPTTQIPSSPTPSPTIPIGTPVISPAKPPAPESVCPIEGFECYDAETDEFDASCQCNLYEPGAKGNYPAPFDCTKFISCQPNHENPDGLPGIPPSDGYIMDCPKGLFYNIKLGVCDWPDQISEETAVDCCPVENFVTIVETVDNCFTESGLDVNCFCNVGGPKESGFYANPADCTQFIGCTSNRGLESYGSIQGCPPTTYYDENRQVCVSVLELQTNPPSATCPTKVEEEIRVLSGGTSQSSSLVLDSRGIQSSDDRLSESTNTQSSSSGSNVAVVASVASVAGVAVIAGVAGFVLIRRKSGQTAGAGSDRRNSRNGELELPQVATAPAGRVGNIIMSDQENLRQRTPRGGRRGRGNDPFA